MAENTKNPNPLTGTLDPLEAAKGAPAAPPETAAAKKARAKADAAAAEEGEKQKAKKAALKTEKKEVKKAAKPTVLPRYRVDNKQVVNISKGNQTCRLVPGLELTTERFGGPQSITWLRKGGVILTPLNDEAKALDAKQKPQLDDDFNER